MLVNIVKYISEKSQNIKFKGSSHAQKSSNPNSIINKTVVEEKQIPYFDDYLQ